MTVNKYRLYFLDDENVLELDRVMAILPDATRRRSTKGRRPYLVLGY
jgi:hypothetical protein